MKGDYGRPVKPGIPFPHPANYSPSIPPFTDCEPVGVRKAVITKGCIGSDIGLFHPPLPSPETSYPGTKSD